MSSDAILTAALRNNLLNLQDTQRSSERSQVRAQLERAPSPEATDTDSLLPTQSLNESVSELNRLLDDISSSIKTIEQAREGISEISDLAQQLGDTIRAAIESGEDASSTAQDLSNRITQTIGNAGNNGVNLLQGDTLVTSFNENQRGNLETKGLNVTSNGLPFDGIDFSNYPTLEAVLVSIELAQKDLTSLDQSFQEDLEVIRARRDFAEGAIAAQKSGANTLNEVTVTDQNEEGANLLALQTRQSLTSSDLSLASPTQQSVLRFF